MKKNDVDKYIEKNLRKTNPRRIAIPLIPLIIVVILIGVITFICINNSGKANTRILIEESSYNDSNSEMWKNGFVICENGNIYKMKKDYFSEQEDFEDESADILKNTTIKERKVV